MGKQVTNAAKRIVQKIINFIRFIPTVLGQVCMWIALVICAIVIIYLIINIISHAIAGLLGIEDSGLANSADYELLSQLTASGYDAIMPADDLQEYYAYEYAVLMDLARNLEEAGVYTPTISDTAEYDPALLTVNDWAQLCAEALSTATSDATKSSAKSNYGNIKSALKNAQDNIKTTSTYAEARKTVENALTNSGAIIPENVKDKYIDKLTKQAMAQSSAEKPSNEMTKEEVIYKSVTSDTTGETSLVPYLVVERPSIIYTYSFVDKSLANATQSQYSSSNYMSTLNAGYIENNIRPLMANSTLNANNKSLHKNGAPGSSTPIDLTLKYNEAVFSATKKDACVTYQIPLKVLADRYMPKAVLLSSWYMLKQNETSNDGSSKTVDTILAEIKKIYNEACLKGEIEPTDNWLLVKEVASADKTTENVVMKNIFNRKDFSTESSLTNYLYKLKGEKLLTGYDDTVTTLIYEKYNTDYDSREYSSTKVLQSDAESLTNQQATTGASSSLLEAYNQTFGGTLKEDIVDDLELVIAHHNEVANNFINSKQYKKAIEDFKSRLGDNITLETTENIDEKDDKYTIYRTDENANYYLINCVKFADEEHHHAINPKGSNHNEKYGHDFGTDECYEYALKESEHKDPYSTSSVECFIPQINVMFARAKTDSRESTDASGNTVKSDVSVKSTAVIIIDGNTKYLYRVNEKEIKDLAGISNNVSFMEFDRYDAQMTNIGDWKETIDGDKDDSTYFVVTDAFEAWPLKINNSGTKNVSSASYTIISANGSDTLESFINSVKRKINSTLSGDDFKEKLKGKVADGQITALYTGGLAVIRNGADWVDANGEFKEEALIPPENAAPNSKIAGNYNTSQIGEATEVTDLYLNVKGISDTDKETINSSVKDLISNVIVTSIIGVKRSSGIEIYSGQVTEEEIEAGTVKSLSESEIKDTFFTVGGVSFDEDNKAVIYPVEQRVTTITQSVKQRSIPMYLPRYADTWSSKKSMKNTFEVMGEFDPTCSDENGGYFQLIPSSLVGGGVNKINITINNEWRTKFYAEHFSKVRENDVLAMISEWEVAGEEGVFAAYTYIRDLYSLIQKSKNVKDQNGVSYVHEDSYKYMYIPDEILYFDESVTDKAYWLEHLLATGGEDAITYEENLTMRNKRNVKTWQIVDYEKYEECEDTNSNGEKIYNVYALWPLGGYLGKSLYAFEANAGTSANQKIILWGFYTGPGGHTGLDLYGRGNAARIYQNAFGNGEANIKAEYNGGKVTLTDAKGNNVEILGSSDDGVSVEGADSVDSNDINNTGKISGSTNLGVYMNTTVTINLDGKDVTFGGTTSAVYGYELYRLTKAYKDGEKAEKVLKETLEEEMVDTPIVAVAPGKVIEVNGKLKAGFVVYVEHVQGDGSGSKVKTTYAHMKRWPEVQIGEYVGAGTILGYEGTTGNSSGNHTHHELTIDGKIGRYPIPYLYPFFTPFYYEDKAAENNYEISNEYMSLIRTIFPYGQKIDTATSEQKLDYAIPPTRRFETRRHNRTG